MIERVRKIFSTETNSYESEEILDLSQYIKYNTNVYSFPTQPEETFNPDVYVLLSPDCDILPTDWLKRDGLEFKIKKYQKIEYNNIGYLIKVWY